MVTRTMNPSSAKQKGRKTQQEVVFQLRFKYNFDENEPSCYEGDIQAITMGATGADIKLSPSAKKVIPFDIEVKNQERLNIWSALAQANCNTSKGRVPLLVFRRNRTQLYACLPFTELLRLLK